VKAVRFAAVASGFCRQSGPPLLNMTCGWSRNRRWSHLGAMKGHQPRVQSKVDL
jgi:hypothetical protein